MTSVVTCYLRMERSVPQVPMVLANEESSGSRKRMDFNDSSELDMSEELTTATKRSPVDLGCARNCTVASECLLTWYK